MNSQGVRPFLRLGQTVIDVALGGRVGAFQITRASKVCELALHKMRYTNPSLVHKDRQSNEA